MGQYFAADMACQAQLDAAYDQSFLSDRRPLYQIGAFLASSGPSCHAVSGQFTTTASDFSRVSRAISNSTLPAK
jgi:hypothetical protein